MDIKAIDKAVGYDSIEAEEYFPEREYISEQRGFGGDLVSSVVGGVGDTVGLLGSATGADWIIDMADAISGTEIAKPDLDTRYGLDSAPHRWITNAVRSAPTSVATALPALAGAAVAGPAGAVAGMSLGLGIIGKGTYQQSLEEIRAERPDLDEREQKKYAMIMGFAEAGTEGLFQAIPFVSAKAVKGLAGKELAKKLLLNGTLNADEAINSAVGKVGAKQLGKTIFGGAAVDGFSEGLTHIVQSGAREDVGLDPQGSLIDAIMTGFIMGTAGGGAGTVKGAYDKGKIKQTLEARLGSESESVRLQASQDIGKLLGKVDASLETAWLNQYGDKIAASPQTLESLTTQTEVEERTDPVENQKVVDKLMIGQQEIPDQRPPISTGPKKRAERQKAIDEANIRPEARSEYATVDPAPLPTEPVPSARTLRTQQLAEEVAPSVEAAQNETAREDARQAYIASAIPATPTEVQTIPEDIQKQFDQEVDRISNELGAAKAKTQAASEGVKRSNIKQLLRGGRVYAKWAAENGKPIEGYRDIVALAEKNNVEVESVSQPRYYEATNEIKALKEVASNPATPIKESKVALKEAKDLEADLNDVVEGTGVKLKAEEIVTTKEDSFQDLKEEGIDETKRIVEDVETFEPAPKKESTGERRKIVIKRKAPVADETLAEKPEEYDARSDDTPPPEKLESLEDVPLTDGGKGKRWYYPDGTIVEYDAKANKDRRYVLTTPDKKSYTGNASAKNEALVSKDYSSMRPWAPKKENRSSKADVTARRSTEEARKEATAFVNENIKEFGKVKDKGSLVTAAEEMLVAGKELTVDTLKKAARAASNRTGTTGKLKGEAGGEALSAVSGDTVEVSQTVNEVREVPEYEKPIDREIENKEELIRKMNEELAKRQTNPYLMNQQSETLLDEYNNEWSGEKVDEFWENVDKTVAPEYRENFEGTNTQKRNYAAVLAQHLKTHGQRPRTQKAIEERIIIQSEANLDASRKGAKVSEGWRSGDKNISTGTDLLDYTIEVSDGVTKALAKAIGSIPSVKEILAQVKVTSGGLGSYQQGNTINIGTANYVDPHAWLHEIQHALTAHGLKASKKLREDVGVMINHLRNSMVKEGILTQKQVDQIKTFKGDATKYNEEFKGTPLEKEYGYALVNQDEFLAQMFSSVNVQAVARRTNVRTKVAGSGILHNLWKKFTGMVAKILKFPKNAPQGYESLLEQSMKVSTELYEIPYSKSAATDTTLNSMLTDAERNQSLDSQVDEIMKQDKVSPTTEAVNNSVKSAGELAKKAFVPVQDRLHNLSPKLARKQQAAENNINTRSTQAKKDVKDFIKEIQSLDERSLTTLHMGLINRKFGDKGILDLPGELKGKVTDASWKKVQKALRTLHEQAEKAGTTSDWKGNYFPRRVADIYGLMDELFTADEKGIMEATFKKAADRKGAPLTDAEKSQLITDAMTTGKFMGPKTAGALKEKTVGIVTPKIYKYYMGLEDSLYAHIAEMTEKTGMREYVGGSLRKQMLAEKKRLMKAVVKAKGTKKVELQGRIDELDLELFDLESDLENGLGNLVRKELAGQPSAKVAEAMSVIKARINQQGAHGVVDTVKNVGYGMTMGSVTSTLTQLPEGGFMFKRFGFDEHTRKAFSDSLRAIGKIISRDVFRNDVGEIDAMVENADFSNALREHSGDGRWSSGKLLDFIFKYSGLKFVDLFGKEVMMRGAMAHYKTGKNDAKFMEVYTDYFGSEALAKETLAEIKRGEVTDKTLGVMMFELSQYQPISLSQYPQAYLEGGNMRVLYSLKGFTIRTTNAAIRDAMDEVKHGKGSKQERIARGAWKFASVIGFYALMGAGTDELKDLLKGRESDFEQNVYDNILNFAFLNKFAVERGLQSDNLLTAIINQQIPPVRWFDNFTTDVAAITGWSDKEFKYKSFNLFPFVGNILYAHSDAGRDSWNKQWRKEISKAAKDGANHADISGMIRTYNDNLLEGDKRLTMSNVLKSARERK